MDSCVLGIVSHQRHRYDLVAFYAEWCGFAYRKPACAGFCLVSSSGDAAGAVFK